MTEKQDKACTKLGLYMAAVGSRSLWDLMAASSRNREIESRLLEAFSRREITPDIFHDVQKLIVGAGGAPPITRYCSECDDPCPDPPCPDGGTDYIRDVINVLKRYSEAAAMV